MKQIEICDVTLRDGAQGEGISFSAGDKLGIITVLSRLGIGMIEAGAPGMNARDEGFFKTLSTLATDATLSAFGQTRRKDTPAKEDKGLQKLIESNAECITIFGKSHLRHVTQVLRVTPEENLAMIRESVAYLKSFGRRVAFDAEHFFDGYQLDPAYALATLDAAVEGGCELLVLCDTNGGTFPRRIHEICRLVVERYPTIRIGIHCHNDMGLAVACSIEAVEAGVTHVQGSFTGIGERCGNTALCQLIPSLQEKMGYHCIYPEGMTSLGVAARYISDLSNTRLPDGTPYVGSSAFSHKAGTHVDALQKLPGAYEHIDPRAVGNERRFLASELAGRAAILEKIQRVAPDIQAGDPAVDRVLASLKDLENRGWQFDSADASMEVLILRTLGRLPEYYTPEFFNVSDSFPLAGDTTGCLATVKIRVGEQTALECAEGDGPVHAMDTALRKCLASFYPSMGDMRLLVYKVRVTSPGETTAARVRVLINSTDGKRIWTTIGTSRDIIRASWKALSDSVDYHLYHQEF